MDLHVTMAEGDPDLLLRSVVQEYAWIGWDADQIAALFGDPFYPLLYGLRQALGEAGVRQRIDAESFIVAVCFDSSPQYLSSRSTCRSRSGVGTGRSEEDCHAASD